MEANRVYNYESEVKRVTDRDLIPLIVGSQKKIYVIIWICFWRRLKNLEVIYQA